jgi:hypothetical protein
MATHTPVLIDELFGELAPAPDGQRWEVIHTKPRCEKKLAEYARRSGITYYLPQMDSKRVYQRRIVNFTKPMFPSYLFVVLDPRQRQTCSSPATRCPSSAFPARTSCCRN